MYDCSDSPPRMSFLEQLTSLTETLEKTTPTRARLSVRFPRLCREMLWAGLPEGMITYRKQHVVLWHLHHAHFCLLHILILALHHCEWGKQFLHLVLKNRSVERVSPSLEPSFLSILRSRKLFWGTKLFCSDHQVNPSSTVLSCFLGLSLKCCLLSG